MTLRRVGVSNLRRRLLVKVACVFTLLVNVACAWHLLGVRTLQGSLTRAAFLSARNDAVANVAIIVAGALTAAVVSPWPDLIVGLGILALNLGAAVDVFKAARQEHRISERP